MGWHKTSDDQLTPTASKQVVCSIYVCIYIYIVSTSNHPYLDFHTGTPNTAKWDIGKHFMMGMDLFTDITEKCPKPLNFSTGVLMTEGTEASTEFI